jgi:hypothetical protein
MNVAKVEDAARLTDDEPAWRDEGDADCDGEKDPEGANDDVGGDDADEDEQEVDLGTGIGRVDPDFVSQAACVYAVVCAADDGTLLPPGHHDAY